jgi:hypothetical protein
MAFWTIPIFYPFCQTNDSEYEDGVFVEVRESLPQPPPSEGGETGMLSLKLKYSIILVDKLY